MTGPRVRAVPAARALARSLGVDLESLRGSGRGGLITLDDVMQRAGSGALRRARQQSIRRRGAAAGRAGGDVEVLRSLRRAMAQSMAPGARR